MVIVMALVFIPIAYWPGGDIIADVMSPLGYMLWVVVGIPGLFVLFFLFQSYMNIEEDKQLETGEEPDAPDREAAQTDGGER